MTTDPLLQRLSGLPWPRPALDLPEPTAGQFWRAAWEKTACLVVLLGPPRGRVVPVAAASSEAVGDETTVLAATEDGLSPAVWGSVTGSIKLFALEHRIADLTVEAFAAVRDAVAGTAPGRWAPIDNVLDDRTLVRAQLVEGIERLAEAEWVPQASGRTLAEQAAAAGIDVPEVYRALGVPPGDARNLLLGRRPVRPEEKGPLTELLGTAPEEGFSYDEELMMAIDQPQRRARMERQERAGVWTDPVALRRALAETVLPMAARMRGQAHRDWGALVDEVLDAD